MKFGELPQETQDLATQAIESSNLLDPPWKSSPEEPYGIRRFNPIRSEDTQRYKDMDRHPEVLKWMLPPEVLSNEDLDSLIRTDESVVEDHRAVWAIVDERNEALGWIQFYPDEILTKEKRKELGIPENALILETSYCKLFNEWPKYSRFIKDRDNLDTVTNYGIASSGLKQSLIKLKQMESVLSENLKIEPKPLFITGYTDLQNIASESALIKNNFQKIGTVDYESEINNAWIVKA